MVILCRVFWSVIEVFLHELAAYLVTAIFMSCVFGKVASSARVNDLLSSRSAAIITDEPETVQTGRQIHK